MLKGTWRWYSGNNALSLLARPRSGRSAGTGHPATSNVPEPTPLTVAPSSFSAPTASEKYCCSSGWSRAKSAPMATW